MKAAKNTKVSRPGALHDGWPARESLDNFLKVVSGVIPLLDAVKESLEESTGSIPKASRQLDNVTKATETATVEILDLLEQMSARVTTLGKEISAVRSASEEREPRLAEIDALISRMESTSPDLYGKWKAFRAAGAGMPLPAGLEALCGAIGNDVMNIGMALQVQDITTQQIAGVSHMIESIRLSLAEVLRNFNDGDRPPVPAGPRKPEPVDANGHFNGDAEYSRSPDRQEDADEIVERWKRGNHA